MVFLIPPLPAISQIAIINYQLSIIFCEQCEQTASGNGCPQWSACGKSPQVNAVQNLLVY